MTSDKYEEHIGAYAVAQMNGFYPNGLAPQLGGKKADNGKVRLDLIPPEAITELGKVLTFGAEKYGARNWEKGIDYGRVYGALQRHLNAWWSGEMTDPETGFSHLAHALCNIVFLVTYEKRGIKTETHPHAPK